MAQQYRALEDKHIEFIARQQMYFVGSAGAEGFVNVSPKGMDSLRVLGPNRVAWLNLTGSGNETAAHVLENGRMTVMFCSYDAAPLILRLYGKAEVVYPRHERWDELAQHFPAHAGARQFFDLDVAMVQTSCGYAVPRYEFVEQRPTLVQWAEKHGAEGVMQYWQDKNRVSLDGADTGIFE
ncbi:pyridoxamine 5'-phosphate oxidase family protein [Mangrovimicrobium sediminis]|uniref:Pyridoxamine 5'-phosphate oxidase family protein n=1 Tax=Mangrovimicrobium sediminis TaxID=2562682 RepID=A0A4Z0LVF8_9GAMM|nr:pyridoxamine 5'-phosphate oxidase family protein [Haliea sp. SAOS-164]TGD71383.1 pyridoxamine 5'-phosphate oxidase family protein [Haliea sp. SAOS-164]